MSNELERRWFQIHLSTAIFLTLTAGLLLWRSCTNTAMSAPSNPMQVIGYGWPWPAIVTIQQGGKSESDWLGMFMVLDALAWMIALGLLGLICEWKIRRKTIGVKASNRTMAKGLVCGLSAIVAATFFIAFTPFPLPIPYQIHAVLFRERMRLWADIDAIKNWQSTLTIQPANNGNVEVPRELWPPCISSLAPQDVCLMPNGDGLQIFIGGSGFGHWGLLVAGKGKMIPVRQHEYLFPLCDGAAVFEAE